MDDSLLFSRYLYKELKISLSDIVPQTGNNDTSRFLLIVYFVTFLVNRTCIWKRTLIKTTVENDCKWFHESKITYFEQPDRGIY